ncbi:MAG: hypothetical protein Q3980_11480 [Turicibacter sp.]|nr:hypothetical protein [Turicibacter sp.]
MKKKKGSAMLSVTIFTTVIIAVAAVSLTVVANDYKMKVNESKKVANLYGAESGLNMAYNVLVKVFDYAVEVSNQAVEAMLDNNDLALDDSQEKMNEVFQDAFISVFESETLPGDKNGTKIDGILEYCLSQQQYPAFKDDKVVFQDFDFSSSDQLAIHVDRDRKDLKFIFTFTSDFTSSTQVTQSNERQVSVKYSINVPTYQGAIKENFTTVSIENYPIFIDSVVNIDGNALLTGNINVIGNLRVKGLHVDTNEVVYEKYTNGLNIKNGQLNLQGNIMTNETVSLNENGKIFVTAKIDEKQTGNIYARNVYVGKDNIVSLPTNASLTVSDSILLDNDLSVNVQADPSGKKSTVHTTNLYGLNDKNLVSNDGNPVRESSSLIVNSDGATIEVAEETYLSGVAYIDTKDECYQTGESVAIRGNYLTYSEVLPGYENRVQMKYYNPLLLVEVIDGDSSLNKKAQYFVYASIDGSLELKDGGVKLNPTKTHTVGAWISEGQVSKLNSLGYNEQDEQLLSDKRKLYASQVFNMGMPSSPSAYQNGKVLKTVANQIKFEHDLFSNLNKEFNNYYGEVILNGDEQVLIIIKANEDGTNDVIYMNTNQSIIKTVPNVHNALIITKGDILLLGNVDFTGNIIAAGSLYVDKNNQTNGDVSLNFDKQVTQQIIAVNYTNLKEIFNVDSVHHNPTEVEVVDGIGLDDIKTKYYAEDYIRAGRWQLLK